MEELDTRKIQNVVKAGYDRLQKYRRAQSMFIKEYVGQYYRQEHGLTGDEPVNMLFSAVRAIVPNIVAHNPTNQVETNYLEHKEYASLLSLGLDQVEKRQNLKATIRAGVTSALFMMGIFKVGLSASGNSIWVGDRSVDPGDIYVEMVDLDDFVIDPNCKKLEDSRFFGHRLTVPRRLLLDSEHYDTELVKKLPSISQGGADGGKQTADLSRRTGSSQEMVDMEDLVHIIELWIPDAEAIVTIPDPHEAIFDDFISMQEYYGPDCGPYVFLRLTPPVPNNPMPVAPVSIYYDLHRACNKTFKKILQQSERQKDILLYDPSHADVAQDIANAEDGDTIAAADPNQVNLVSIGGQNRDNAAMMQQLQIWFNYMAGNPDQLAGMQTDAMARVKTATQAQILQSNAAITVEDARDLVYDATAEISKRVAWFMHTDPLIEMQLARRTDDGGHEQLILTPAQRRGDWLEFIFSIKPKSMSMVDPQLRSQRIMEFAQNIMPQGAMSAMYMMQMGIPFNLTRYLSMVAEELQIGEWVQELFMDPQFQQRMQMMMAMGPQNPGKAQGQSPSPAMQNGGFPMQRTVMDQNQQFRHDAQQGAAGAQADMRMGGGV